MTNKQFVLLVLVGLVSGVIAIAQAYSPVVYMTVVLPDGETRQISAPESGLALLTLKDGREFGLRPTILDDKPWTHVVVTIFKMATESQATRELGEFDLKTGAPAVQSKTTPVFKIAVTKVEPPAS
jgi:hypothetical protein